MKKTLLSITLFLFIGITAMAQVPQAFNYQGVARDISGHPMANTPISLRLSVHDLTAGGTVVYQETQNPTTNSFGLFNVGIGNGTIVSGTFTGVNWGTGNKYVEVEIDPAGGTNYTSAGTNQLLSVPYAVYSNNAASAGALTGTVTMGGDVTGTNAASSVVKLQGNSVSAAVPTSGQVLSWNSGTSSWVPFSLPAAGSVTSITAGTGLSGGTITTSGTISMPNVGTAGTYGSATQVPVITTDAQGRVSGVTNTTITGDNWGTQIVQTDATIGGNGTTLTPLKIAQQGATTGQALEWNGTSWMPATLPVAPTYTAGTGMTLAGTTFNAQTTNALWNANELQGNIISATAPASGQGLLWSGTAWTPTTIPSTTYTSGTGINVAGTVINAQTTSALWNANELQGNIISGTAPSTGQGLVWSGASWAPATLTGTAISAGTGITIAGGVVNAQTTTALWNANELQGKNISATAPTSGQGLVWNSGTSMWTPTNLTSGTLTSITAGAGLSGGTITTSGTISMPNVGTTGTFGSATQVPVFTTDAQGRITGVTNTTIPAAPTYSAGTGLSLVGTTFSMPNTGTAGTYGSATQVPVFTTDAQGRITGVTNTTIPSGTTYSAGTGLSLIGTTFSMPNTGTASTYGSATQVPVFTTDAQGRITGVTNTTIAGGSTYSAGAGLSLIGTTFSMPNTGTAGTYGSATQVPVFTTDAQGRITGVANTTIAGTTYTAGTGITIAGTTVSAQNTFALWNANQLQGKNISATPPAAGQELVWNAGTSMWTPTNPSSGTLTSITAGAGLSGGTITTSGTISMPNVGTAGTYGSTTLIPVITTDAQGRVSAMTTTTVTTGVAGTVNYIPKFTSATAIGNSQVFDNGTSVGLGTITPTATNKLQVLNSSTAANQHAVHGISGSAATGSITVASGIYGESNTGIGVSGVSTTNDGIFGYSTSGTGVGVDGYNTAAGGIGVFGGGTAAGSIGGQFDGGTSGYGLVVSAGLSGFGTYTPGAMVHVSGSKDLSVTLGGSSFGHQAFISQTSSTSTANVSNAIIGYSTNSTLENHGLHGWANGSSGTSWNIGAFCTGSPSVISTGNSYGVYATAANGANNYGVYATSTGTGYAGYFNGAIYATTGSFGIKPFKIDDPRDPANKYLYHSSIESNEMMNIYKGHVTTDANGNATVTLPSYFTILNKDYDYQLTCIGQFAQAIVSEEIRNNQFKIKTDKPNVKVSWQVSGVRQDPVANAYRIKDEVEKPANEKGTYLQPEVYGLGPEKGTGYLKSANGSSSNSDTKQTTSNPAPATKITDNLPSRINRTNIK